jgi:hypothetical protein
MRSPTSRARQEWLSAAGARAPFVDYDSDSLLDLFVGNRGLHRPGQQALFRTDRRADYCTPMA